MRILSHILAYVLALCGGVVVLFLASSVPALMGLSWPRGILLALPFAAASSILPYAAALALLGRRARRSLNLHLFAGALVALLSVGLFALVFGLDIVRFLVNGRTILGILLAGAVGGYMQFQVTDAFATRAGGARA